MMTAEKKESCLSLMWSWNLENPLIFNFIAIYLGNIYAKYCEGLMSNNELHSKIRAEKFDLAIGESFFTSCHLGLYEAEWGIKKHIIISSSQMFSPHYELLGLDFPLTATPEMFADFSSFNLINRFKNWYYNWMAHFLLRRPFNLEQELFDVRYGKGVKDVLIYLINSLDFGHPRTSKVIELGGFSIPQFKALDEYWQNVMNQRKNTILISFGSMSKAYLMPDHYKANFIKIIQTYPDTTFIFKYEVDDGFGKDVDNLIINKWLPQPSLLVHPKMTGFITHGGLNSLTEGIFAGVPLLLIALFGDQKRHIEIATKVGFGKDVNKQLLGDYNYLRGAIDEVFFKSDKYKVAALRIRDSIKDAPNSNTTEQFIKHVEYAIKYGPQPMLNMLGQEQNFIEKNNLDLLLIGSILLVVYLYAVFKLFKYCCCRNKIIIGNEKKNE
uniref:UDP-glucuronosyltransferase n=1 Tax=Rhabditophanes sp. KR3021 TaxID=114890 RepID=A0AC35U1C3_9BILA